MLLYIPMNMIGFRGNGVFQDFNIQKEAGGSKRALIRTFKANVTNTIMDIHFFWAGKGTCSIPYQGTYGPLVWAIHVSQGFRTCYFSYFSFKFLIPIWELTCSTTLFICSLWWYRLFQARQEPCRKTCWNSSGMYSWACDHLFCILLMVDKECTQTHSNLHRFSQEIIMPGT